MYQHKYVMVGNIRTHYLEAGEGEPLLLVHSGEYGACAENSWERNIEELSQHFRVLAIDMIGYGETDKLHHFGDMRTYRQAHLRDFLRALCIEQAAAIGNSFGGSLLLEGSIAPAIQPLTRVISVAGGGPNDPTVLQELYAYDGTKEGMKKILDVLFHDPRFKTEEYVARRVASSLIPGHWESMTAAHLRSPKAVTKTPAAPDFARVSVPALICAGAHDTLKPLALAEKLSQVIPNCQLQVFQHSAHCPHLEEADAFNRVALNFLMGRA